MSIRAVLGGVLVEELDADTGLCTRYNPMGAVLDQRPLTATELAAVRQYDTEQAKVSAVAQAQQQVDGIQQQQSSFHQQLQADIAAVQGGWDTLTADQRTAIMGRVLNGFSTVMTGLHAHAAVTGAIDPLAT